MCKYLEGIKQKSLFVLACGAVVRVKQAADNLKTIVKR